MSITSVLERLLELTQEIPGIGQVWDYERINLTTAEIESVLGIPDQTSARGWSVRTYQWYRRGRPGEHLDPSGYVVEYTHQIHLRGYWEVNDAYASEREWREMTDTICAVFNSPLALDGYAHRFTYPQVVFEGHAVLNETYLCHDVEIAMAITEKADTSDYDTSPIL